MSAHVTEQTPDIYGLMAEFPDPTSLVLATRKTHEEGYRELDAYSPFPIHELFDAFMAHDLRVQRAGARHARQSRPGGSGRGR